MNDLPKCPVCGVALKDYSTSEYFQDFRCANDDCDATVLHIMADDPNRKGVRKALCKALSGHRIGDELLGRIVELLDEVAEFHEPDCKQLLSESYKCNCYRDRASTILSELAEVRG